MNLIISLMLCTALDVGNVVEKLRPDVPEATKSYIVYAITTRATKYGLKEEDYPLILSMAKKESDFTHMHGTHGEIGVLQVIPEDGHIMEIVSKIVCEDEEYCKDGSPDIWSDEKISSWKVRRFLVKHPKYAFEAGMGEMQYWKQTYDESLKARFWTKFPSWYLKKHLENFELREYYLKRWWERLVEEAGEYVWISHYNWGAKLSTATSSRNYALQVVTIMKTI